MRVIIVIIFGLLWLNSGCTKGFDESEPSCTDGILNQDEASIDCGGVCTACPTCTDGIRNQGENSIDCGGPCQACATIDCTTCTNALQGSSITYCEDAFESDAAYQNAINSAIADGWTCN